MAAPAIEIQERGAARAARSLHDMGVRGSNVRPAGADVEATFHEAERRRFDSKGDGSWQALAQSTLEAKSRKGHDPRIMRATGALFASLTKSSGPSQVDKRQPTELRFGTTLRYAVFHEDGRGVPKRTLIDLSPRDRDEIEDTLARYIAGTKR